VGLAPGVSLAASSEDGRVDTEDARQLDHCLSGDVPAVDTCVSHVDILWREQKVHVDSMTDFEGSRNTNGREAVSMVYSFTFVIYGICSASTYNLSQSYVTTCDVDACNG
jgi:hypothetical protein